MEFWWWTVDLGILPANLVDTLGRQPRLGAARPNYHTFDRDTGLEVRTGAPRTGTAVVTADTGTAPGGTIKIGGRTFAVASVAAGTRTVGLTAEDIRTVLNHPFLADVQVDPAVGVTKADARTALNAALAGFPTAVAYDHDEYVEHLNAQLNQGLDVVTALLALAVVI